MLWLIGMMGSGKSAVGRLLADQVDAAFFDTDVLIEQRLGCSIGQLWGAQGEQAFRDMEAAQVKSLAAGKTAVVATGGGVVLREDSVELMRASGTVVWLEASAAILADRVGADSNRPLLAGDSGPDRIGELLTEREPSYAAASHERIDTAGRSAEEIADELVGLWNDS